MKLFLSLPLAWLFMGDMAVADPIDYQPIEWAEGEQWATVALPTGVVYKVRAYATESCSPVGLLDRFVKKVRGVGANEYWALKFDERTQEWIQWKCSRPMDNLEQGEYAEPPKSLCEQRMEAAMRAMDFLIEEKAARRDAVSGHLISEDKKQRWDAVKRECWKGKP
jgi:hypothetical protein